MNEKEVKGIIIQAIAGLKAMKQRDDEILHLDLKPSNIMYDRGITKIIDFGLSKVIREEDKIKR